MNLIPWRRGQSSDFPSTLTHLRSDVERLFDRFFDPYAHDRGNYSSEMWMPVVDVKDKPGEVTVCAELPGLNAQDIDISVSDNIMTIRGERKEESEDEREGYYMRERRYGAFARSIELPPGADANGIDAEYRNGELIVHIPKTESQRLRRIEIKPAASRSIQPSTSQRSGSGDGKTSQSKSSATTTTATHSRS